MRRPGASGAQTTVWRVDLSTISKNYAFHYPRSDDVDTSFESICNDPELGGLLTCIFPLMGSIRCSPSDLVFIQGIAEKSGEPDLEAAQKKAHGRSVTRIEQSGRVRQGICGGCLAQALRRRDDREGISSPSPTRQISTTSCFRSLLRWKPVDETSGIPMLDEPPSGMHC